MSNFTEVSRLNTVFGNKRGDLSDPDWAVISKQLHLIQEEVKEFAEGKEKKDLKKMRDAISDILVVTYGMAHIMGIDADADMAAVQASNMSKLCTTPEEIEKTLAYYQNLNMDVHYEGQLPEVAIKSSCDQSDAEGKFYPKGKFLKNTNWHEPVFS